MISEGQLVIFHDDDRVVRSRDEVEQDSRKGAHSRQLHEGVWSLIELR